MIEDQLTEPQAPVQEPSFTDEMKEKIESSPLSAAVKGDLQSYFDFAGSSMPDTNDIYRYFYASDREYLDALAENTQIVEQGVQYRENVRMAAESIKEARQASGETAALFWLPHEKAVRINTGEGYANSDKIGRFYFNIKQEQIAEALPKIIAALDAAGVNAQLKAFCPPEIELRPERLARYIARKDKAVLYFNEQEAAAVLAVIETVYPEVEDAMAEGVPRLAAQIQDSHGEVMRGIGFGEDPTNGSMRESFGEVRSRLLFHLSLYATHPVYGQGSFMEVWEQACQQVGVNPLNPAFNAGDPHFEAVAASTS